MGLCRLLISKTYSVKYILLALVCLSAFLVKLYAISLIIILFMICLYIDEKASNILTKQTAYVYGGKMIRNADSLIIGDMIDTSTLCNKGNKIVPILSPNKTLGASFEILKKMFSIIDENKGKIIIVVKKENSNKNDITLFDYSFISPIHRKMMNIESMGIKRKHPFFYSPVNTIRLFLNKTYKKSHITKCPIKEITEFCNTRNIKFEYREI